MNHGVVAEYDHPHLLLQSDDGFFAGLVRETGRTVAEQLKRISKEVKPINSIFSFT